MENNSWKFKKKSAFSPNVSLHSQRKKSIRNELFPFVKSSEKNSSKKVMDFPLHLTLFIKSQETNKTKEPKMPKTNKFNIKLSSFKPKDLNIKKFNVDNIIKPKEKNILSRNLNLSNNSNILSFDSFNSSKIMNVKKLLSTIKSPRIKLKNINYSPLNIHTKNSPIIINQIGIENSSTSKFSTKMNNLSNNSIENEISVIKNTSNRHLSYKNLSSNDRKLSSIFPINKRRSVFERNRIVKPQLKELKKLFQKDFSSFDLDKKHSLFNIDIKATNIIKENDNDANVKEIKSNINKSKKNSINSINSNKFNLNFKLSKERINNKHNTINITNVKNNITTLNKSEQEKKEISENEEKEINQSQKNSDNDIKKLSKSIENENEENKEVQEVSFLKRKKTHRKTNRSRSRKLHTHKKNKLINISNNKFYLLQYQETHKNKFLEKIKDNNFYIFEQQNQHISLEKSELLLNIKTKISNYTHNIKRKNIIETTGAIFQQPDFKTGKEIYFHKITKNNNNFLLNQEKSNTNKNLNLTEVLSQYLLTEFEFEGISSSNKLYRNRRNAKFFEIKPDNKIPEEDIMIQGKIKHKEEETFKRTKSNVFQLPDNNNFQNDDWMYNSKNLIRIQEISLKSNNLDNINPNNFNNRNINQITKKTLIRKSTTLNILVGKSSTPVKKNFLHNFPQQKTNSFSPLRKRKSLRIAFKNKEPNKRYSILQMKKFFIRNIPNVSKSKGMLDMNEELDFYNLSDNYRGILSSNNVTKFKLEEYYYFLFNCILQGLNKNFINCFQKFGKRLDINEKIYDGNTLLIFSAKEGNVGITKYLAQQGADVNIQNDDGNTALHYAIANHFFSIVDILKANGAKEDITNKNGLSPWECIEHGL